MKLKFNLKLMLFVVAICACSLALVTQIGMTTGEFVVTENNLQQDPDGLINGELSLSYLGDDYYESWDFDCKLVNVKNDMLLQVKPEDRGRFRYRGKEIGPLKKQEPCAIYLTRFLGIAPDEITGYVFFEGGTQVVINGER